MGLVTKPCAPLDVSLFDRSSSRLDPDQNMTTSTRDKLLAGGFELLFDHGYEAAGVKEITSSCGVPKGSFYHYFESKEAFAVAVVEHYLGMMRDDLERRLVHGSGRPIDRLRRLFASWTDQAERGDFRRGCLAGLLCQEMASKNAVFQRETARVFSVLQGYLEDGIRAAQQANEMASRDDPSEVAEFLLNSWQGALLRMKASKSRQPLERFQAQIFDKVLC